MHQHPDAWLAPRPVPRPARRVALTGATGFIGAHLVAELLDRGAAEVLCIVRAANCESAHARVRSAVARYGLWKEAYAERINCVIGDLATPGLGLSVAARNLLETVDVWVHNGASVHYLESYEALKGANVDGTRAVLDLAAARDVPVHLVSSLGVFSPLVAAGDRSICEATPPDDFATLHSGYTQSKWMQERLADLAAARGQPVFIHRPGRTTGHSVTGCGNQDDFFYRFVASCLALKAAPDVDRACDVTPVNFVAASIVAFALDPDARPGTYHHAQPLPWSWREMFSALREQERTLDLVSYADWVASLWRFLRENARARDRAAERLYVLLPFFKATSQRPVALTAPHYDVTATAAYVARRYGIACPPADGALMARYFGESRSTDV